MYLYNKMFGTKPNVSTQTLQSPNILFLLYGAKNVGGVETSYLIGVFDTKQMAILEKNKLDKELNLVCVGKTIYNPITHISEYIYKHYIIECELNKNYHHSIEDLLCNF